MVCVIALQCKLMKRNKEAAVFSCVDKSMHGLTNHAAYYMPHFYYLKFGEYIKSELILTA